MAQLHDAPTRERPLVVGRLVRDTPDGLEPAAEISAFTFDVGVGHGSRDVVAMSFALEQYSCETK